jgi:hypothetical protein
MMLLHIAEELENYKKSVHINFVSLFEGIQKQENELPVEVAGKHTSCTVLCKSLVARCGVRSI